MNLEISVVICAHNPPSDYLTRVLDALEIQTLPRSDWEVIMIDNASKKPLSGRFDLSWHPFHKQVFEPQLGLTNARARGIHEAAGEIIVFVDDDNVLAPDYLENALRIGREWPMLGTWGGSITPEFEEPPSPEVQPYLAMLAIREAKDVKWSNVPKTIPATPWGAGICVRRDVGLRFIKQHHASRVKISGRKGQSLNSGEDLELSFVAMQMGLGCGVFPRLKVTHLIPVARLRPEYLVRLREGIEFSDVMLYHKWFGETPRHPFSGLNLLRIVGGLTVKRGLARRILIANLRGAFKARRELLKLGKI